MFSVTSLRARFSPKLWLTFLTSSASAPASGGCVSDAMFIRRFHQMSLTSSYWKHLLFLASSATLEACGCSSFSPVRMSSLYRKAAEPRGRRIASERRHDNTPRVAAGADRLDNFE